MDMDVDEAGEESEELDDLLEKRKARLEQLAVWESPQELDRIYKKRARLTQLAQWGGRPPPYIYTLRERTEYPTSIKEKKGPADLFKSHYARYFPFKEICEWLSYGKPEDLCRREFANTNWKKQFYRYQTYPSYVNFKYWMSTVAPSKIDIGAICDRRPRWDAREALNYVARELTFDIDVSDYNAVRMCCSNNSMCYRCWNFMVVACKILHASFTEDFGWKHILWVFSGRRGVHCWICDEDARQLDEYERHSLLKYFLLENHPRGLIYLGEEAQLHPHIERSGKIATLHFIRVCIIGMNILGNPKGVMYFISLLPDRTTRRAVIKLFAGCTSGLEKWKKFFHVYLKGPNPLPVDPTKKRPHLFKEIALHYLYPRIDTGVTEKLNHLLKTPFSFHPETRKLCTPFDPYKVDDFVFSQVPILWSFIPLAEKRDAYIRDGKPLIKHFQLKSYDKSLRVFRQFLKSFEET